MCVAESLAAVCTFRPVGSGPVFGSAWSGVALSLAALRLFRSARDVSGAKGLGVLVGLPLPGNALMGRGGLGDCSSFTSGCMLAPDLGAILELKSFQDAWSGVFWVRDVCRLDLDSGVPCSENDAAISAAIAIATATVFATLGRGCLTFWGALRHEEGGGGAVCHGGVLVVVRKKERARKRRRNKQNELCVPRGRGPINRCTVACESAFAAGRLRKQVRSYLKSCQQYQQ